MSIAEEKAPTRYVTGYGSLADAIASDDDHSSVIFKRFDTLAARNLLYLQSELAELEALQKQYDQEDFGDANSHDDAQMWMEIRQNARDWVAFKYKAEQPDGQRWKLRMELAMRIREVLKEYREALLQESAMLSLRNPSRQAHTAIWSLFNNEHVSTPFPVLAGSSADIYEERASLVSLGRFEHEDRLTVFLRNHCSFLFKRRQSPNHAGIQHFSAQRISSFVSLITILLASAFLFGAIYHLYYVKRDQVKLGLISGYTVAFAATIGLISNARRAEIFGACAAYAAVLVVFVSGDLGSSGPG